MHKTVSNGRGAPRAGPKSGEIQRSSRPSVAEAVESVVGCKWSLQVLGCIRRGVARPGALVRACPGLSTKVLNERLAKMTRFGILERVAFPEIPPRVEYRLTALGARFVSILDAIEALQARIDRDDAAAPPSSTPAVRRTRTRSNTAD